MVGEHGGYRKGNRWGLGSEGSRKTIRVPPPIKDEVLAFAQKAWLRWLAAHEWVYVDDCGKIYDLSHLRDEINSE